MKRTLAITAAALVFGGVAAAVEFPPDYVPPAGYDTRLYPQPPPNPDDRIVKACNAQYPPTMDRRYLTACLRLERESALVLKWFDFSKVTDEQAAKAEEVCAKASESGYYRCKLAMLSAYRFNNYMQSEKPFDY
jgi:hypothetical protein